jgi:membrane protease YdiL (CAAX protease family)
VKVIRPFFRKHALIAFFVLAFALSWVVWVPLALAGAAPAPEILTLFTIVGGFGPMLAALVVSALEGDGALRRLILHSLRVRVGVVWYGVALLAPIALGASVMGLFRLFGGVLPADWVSPPPPAYPVAWLFVLLLGGGQEEPGWRGFALPRLQVRHSAPAASVILGVVWTLWHGPLFLIPDSAQSPLPLPWYLIHVIAASILYTWLFNNTRGSALLVAFLHAGSNAVASWVPITIAEGLFKTLIGIEWVLAIVLIMVYGGRRLMRRENDVAGAAHHAVAEERVIPLA